MVDLCILILAICRIERDWRRNGAIFQANPGLDLIIHSLLVQENLTSTTGRITITSVSSMPTVAHINSITLQVLINSVTIPFETPVQISNWPAVSTQL